MILLIKNNLVNLIYQYFFLIRKIKIIISKVINYYIIAFIIFNPLFVSHNKYKCKIIYKNEIYPLIYKFKIPIRDFRALKKLRIDLIFFDTFRINLNYMFANCRPLLEIYEHSEEKTLIKLNYDFKDEKSIREKLYQEGDEKLRLDEILRRYTLEHGGAALLRLIWPYITAQFHYD